MLFGPTSPVAVHLAASAAASQRNPAHLDRVQAAQSEQKMHADEVALTQRGLEASGESHRSGDRDADGRLPWQWSTPPQVEGEVAGGEPASAASPLEGLDDRGQQIDVNV